MATFIEPKPIVRTPGGYRQSREDKLRTFEAPGVERCLVREEGGGAFYLIKLKVAPEYQNKGVGSFMLRTLKSYGRRIYLICCPDDPEKWRDLERFYFRHGFRKTGSYMEWNPVDPYQARGQLCDL